MKPDLSQLSQFLLASNQAGYAAGEEKQWLKNEDHSTTISFTQGDWNMDDNFFGGEPYGGRMVVFYQNKPVWMMVYYGYVVEGIDVSGVYKILREALKNMPKDAPFRGPKELTKGKFQYQNKWMGDLESYRGEEKIFDGGKMIYHANYMGGLVDVREGV